MITVKYPANPDAQISRRFKALRKENKDIVGWLTVNTLLDEPVVQRDEVFYMDHDVLCNIKIGGMKIENGRPCIGFALFDIILHSCCVFLFLYSFSAMRTIVVMN